MTLKTIGEIITRDWSGLNTDTDRVHNKTPTLLY